MSKEFVPTSGQRARAARDQAVTPDMEPSWYKVSIPTGVERDIFCPMPGCPFSISAMQAGKRTVMQLHS